jgi:hypothetical protein
MVSRNFLMSRTRCGGMQCRYADPGPIWATGPGSGAHRAERMRGSRSLGNAAPVGYERIGLAVIARSVRGDAIQFFVILDRFARARDDDILSFRGASNIRTRNRFIFGPRRVDGFRARSFHWRPGMTAPNRSARGERARACTHLWTPRQMQAVFEEEWHVVGCCHLSGL